ncbi:nucleotidyl transferase AbiEii/AbiGii toxin family protein [Cedecea sp.]|jgi:predicted nucleotidyltransferase|uniref:nucleotidyl transferase AbiEii/AbiGii toxin family protein n=1 Tax=Cedecea sp. TaxID=1970739 RepID=UPI0012AD2FF1|nr:hypothetical protein [Enterobacteriaceae bacterium RIT693]
MTDIYSLKQPLSSGTETLLERIAQSCTEPRIEFFVAGATAREVILTHLHGRRSGRHTRDIDIAIFIKDWQQFSALKQVILAQGAEEIKGNAHRLVWEGNELDIIPFGEIAEENAIAWPPDRDFVMSVDGFQEAFKSAISIQLSSGTVIRFCSLPGLLLLKLFAWRDRGAEVSRDAVDIFNILKEYSAVEEDRLYDNDKWGEQVDWNPDRLGARLAGSDTALISSPELRQAVLALDKERLKDTITRHTSGSTSEDIDMMIDDFWAAFS